MPDIHTAPYTEYGRQSGRHQCRSEHVRSAESVSATDCHNNTTDAVVGRLTGQMSGTSPLKGRPKRIPVGSERLEKTIFLDIVTRRFPDYEFIRAKIILFWTSLTQSWPWTRYDCRSEHNFRTCRATFRGTSSFLSLSLSSHAREVSFCRTSF